MSKSTGISIWETRIHPLKLISLPSENINAIPIDIKDIEDIVTIVVAAILQEPEFRGNVECFTTVIMIAKMVPNISIIVSGKAALMQLH